MTPSACQDWDSCKRIKYKTLDSWKKELLIELRGLEESLNSLYSSTGVTTSSVIEFEDSFLHEPDGKTWQIQIDELLKTIHVSAQNVCSLISVQTEFHLPLPVSVLLKIATKIGMIRLKDYKKKPNSLIKSYCYSLTPKLVEINLLMFKYITKVSGSNIIPFMPFINQTQIRILDWTRTSGLLSHDELSYHLLRLKVFQFFSLLVDQLSLNINLDFQQLKTLVEVEIIDNLVNLMSEQVSCENHIELHAVAALECLESLIIVYRDLFPATLENKVKRFVVQACIKIYRDFESNVIILRYRKQLLHVLSIIANQPYATSTTEIAYHIFELAEKFERDTEMRSLARICLRVSLAHKPTIVTHYDVYNCYGRPMLTVNDTIPSVSDIEKKNLQESRVVDDKQVVDNDDSSNRQEVIIVDDDEPMVVPEIEEVGASSSSSSSSSPIRTATKDNDESSAVLESMEDESARVATTQIDPTTTTSTSREFNGEIVVVQDEEQACAESEILSYMKHFVEKLA